MEIIATEKVIYRSSDPENLYCYTPALAHGFNGRLIAAVDLGGPGAEKLDGEKSLYGDFPAGNQIRIIYSDNHGRNWKESPARLPMSHGILFKAGKYLYIIGHSGYLLISCSHDNGETWSIPAILDDKHLYHQSCCSVDYRNGKLYLVYEQRDSGGGGWPVALVLMAAVEDSDLTQRGSWTFSKPYFTQPDLDSARLSGMIYLPLGCKPGILETHVLRIYDSQHPWFDPNDRSVVLLSRVVNIFSNIGSVLRGVENSDGSLNIKRFKISEADSHFLIHLPGGLLKFYPVYDERSRLYWLASALDDGVLPSARQQLQLSYSPDLLRWSHAGRIAVGMTVNESRQYPTMLINGDDLLLVSRSGSPKSHSPHDNDLVTLHQIQDFRQYVSSGLSK